MLADSIFILRGIRIWGRKGGSRTPFSFCGECVSRFHGERCRRLARPPVLAPPPLRQRSVLSFPPCGWGPTVTPMGQQGSDPPIPASPSYNPRGWGRCPPSGPFFSLAGRVFFSFRQDPRSFFSLSARTKRGRSRRAAGPSAGETAGPPRPSLERRLRVLIEEGGQLGVLGDALWGCRFGCLLHPQFLFGGRRCKRFRRCRHLRRC